MTVYIGSLWHRDCDPFVTVIARTAEQVEQALEEYERNLDSDCECGHDEHQDEECDVDGCECYVECIVTGEVSAETSIRSYVDGYQLSEVIEVLRQRGVAYI